MGVRAGLGLEDDAQVVKVYLPKEPGLVLKQATSGVQDDEKLKLVSQIMTGVHLAAATEAMSLGAKVGLDLNQLFEIISTAAGASWMFKDRTPQILSGKWTSKETVENVVTRMVCLHKSLYGVLLMLYKTESMEEAHRLKFPLLMGGTALQLFQLASLQGLGNEPDVAVCTLWNGLWKRESL